MSEETGTRAPRIALTMGDVAGIGPEVVARVVDTTSETLVVGDSRVLARALALIGSDRPVYLAADPRDTGGPAGAVPCWNPSHVDVVDVPPATISPQSGQAAVDWLQQAAQAALAGDVDAIVTAPLHKTALAAAGINHPGHTEILAETCGVDDVAMMLYLPSDDSALSPNGLGVAHVTLHTSLASVPGLLSIPRIGSRISLLDQFLRDLGCPAPRIGVCALNPHAGENGLFGDEEAETIAPAVSQAVTEGLDVTGPLPADALLRRAVAGEFDAVVAMYHDQGHIALKLVGFETAVNITLGLPILRTSPSHGTAFDIAWQGRADERGMQAAIATARQLYCNRTEDACF